MSDKTDWKKYEKIVKKWNDEIDNHNKFVYETHKELDKQYKHILEEHEKDKTIFGNTRPMSLSTLFDLNSITTRMNINSVTYAGHHELDYNEFKTMQMKGKL